MLAALSSAKGIALALGALAILAIVAGFWLSYQHTLSQNQALAAEAATGREVNAANVVEHDALQAALERSNAAADAARRAAAQRTTVTNQIKQAIDHAPSTDNAPLAPVLRRAIDQLYPLAAAGAVPAGAAADLSGPAVMPAKP